MPFKLNRAGALVEWQALCAAIKDSVIGLPDKGLTLSASTFPEPALPPYFARHKRCDTFSRGAYGGASMAWFSRFTRFGDVHLVFGQEARMSCGIASVLMCVFKINKLSINADALKKNTEIYALYSRISGGRYKPGEQGTHPHHLASVLNELDCGKWTGEYVSAEALSLLIHRNVGRSGGIGPVSKVNPVIAGVGWQGGGGHATVVDTIRTWNNEKFATVCDPWDANVHVVPFNETKPFSYNAGRGGFSVDFWGAHQGQKLPYPVTAVGGGIAAVYRI